MNAARLPKMLALGRSDHDQLIAQIQYLTIENQILRSKLPKRVSLTSKERRRLIRFGKAVGDELRHLISIVQFSTFQKWLRAPKNKKPKKRTGRPRTSAEIRKLVLEMSKSPGWGYTRILGELRKLGIMSVSRTTVRNILKEHSIEPSPDRCESTWDQFLKRHSSTLWSCDFLTKPVLTWRGIKHQTVLVFLHIASRKVIVTGATEHPNNEWMCRVAECFPSMAKQLGLELPAILVRDNDVKFTRDFDQTLKRFGIEPYPLPIQAPLLNAHVERWIKSLKVECLDHFLPVGTKHLDHIIGEYVEHYHYERPHQGLGNKPIMCAASPLDNSEIHCDSRLGGLLRHYHRAA
ncbi:MAG: integrase core domain-containing protein [Phycisphaerales bacterium]